jgi:hypothetical protein
MSDRQPDLDSDILVQHVREADSSGPGTGDRWLVYLGRSQRSDTANRHGALMFARLLADLNKRPVWVLHDPAGPFEPLDPSTVRGCSCC